jgi:L-lactate dehydrogenase complex protein LldE
MSRPARVQLFVTCIVDSLFPEVGEAAVEVLERLGVAVDFPETQTCCGQPAYNAGFRAEARDLARRFLEVFDPHPLPPASPASPSPQAKERGEGWPEAGVGGEGLPPIVAPSGSCAAMIVHGYADLFADDPHNLTRAKALAARTYEFSQFLVDVLGVTNAGGRFDGELTYHPSCHLLRGLGVQDAAAQLLARVAGAEVVPLPHAEECCGFGGLFSIKHADVSAAMLDKKLENIRASGAQTVVGCDMSCLMHLQGALSRDGSSVRCAHLAEVLRRKSGVDKRDGAAPGL